MNERACMFAHGLVGILTEPEGASTAPQGPAVLLWNVGLVHRVGPFRVYVDLARQLARQGYTVLRFDLSGLGDSEVRSGTGNDLERAVMDIRDAMELVRQRCGHDRFVLVGFCSSVDNAHAAAMQDPCVVGLVQVEGYAYRTRGFYLRYYRRYLDRLRWERVLRARFPSMFRRQVNLAIEKEAVFLREYPTAGQYRAQVADLASRGTRQLFVYVGGDTSYNYEHQFFDMYGSPGLESQVQVAFLPDADHTFHGTRDRRLLIDAVSVWMARSFPIAAQQDSAGAEALRPPAAFPSS